MFTKKNFKLSVILTFIIFLPLLLSIYTHTFFGSYGFIAGYYLFIAEIPFYFFYNLGFPVGSYMSLWGFFATPVPNFFGWSLIISFDFIIIYLISFTILKFRNISLNNKNKI